MRVNMKRVGLGVLFCVFLWLVFSLFFVVEIPSLPSTRKYMDRGSLEKRIELLENTVDNELKESMSLLSMLNEKLEWKKVESLERAEKEAKGKEQRAVDSNVLEPAPSQTVLPVLVIACNRVTVSRCLDKLVRYRPSAETFPIIVSQDCNHTATYQVIQSYATPGSGIAVVQQPDQSDVPLPRSKLKFQGYYKIARHYKFALTHVLDTLGHESVIIVEDDLDVAEDFYEYFLGTYPLLQKDPSLWCVSAWNDNGKKGLIDASHPELLHRSDFFPGLGWLLPARVWDQLRGKWPPAFFDDWLREPNQTLGRSCIRPELPRTSTFGKEGVSKGLFFDLHLRFIKLSDQFVPFTQLDLSYLLKDDYDRRLDELVAAAQPLSLDEVLADGGDQLRPARLSYSTRLQFKKAAHALGLMDDFRSGVPRTAYRGVVSCFFRGRRVYIAPSTPFTKYDPSWS